MTKEEREVMEMALSALEEAKLHIWLADEKGVAANVKCHETIRTILECLANDALEKKAENARKLGLEY